MGYDFKVIEDKWQRFWEQNNSFAAKDDVSLPKYYVLVEFPYPSGVGLHVGHPRSYVALDAVARYKRFLGYNVLYPMGWDAFGLPTENFAMKNHIHPEVVTKQNITRFKSQLKSLGLSFDWSREVNTTDPNYYRWTQWIFLQLFKSGLAYKKEMAVNYCTGCRVVLANEEVTSGVCERCKSTVERRVKSQWMLAITRYAQRLADDLDDVNFIERVKLQQRYWIGKSTGAQVIFGTTAKDEISVYTTRPDTLFGATYMVLAPEHELVEKWHNKLQNLSEVQEYIKKSGSKSDFERTELIREKTGVRLIGVMGINPVNGKEIPIFISDYVLASYGTGAIMAVPGHDERDYAFAKSFNLPIIEVVAGGDVLKEAYTDCESGIMVNSDYLDGLTVEAATEEIIKRLIFEGKGSQKTNFKLRDWVFSRQRYWGEPIPIVHCERCGYVPLPESSLPLVLPDLLDFEPGEEGDSPLAKLTSWVQTTCPTCGEKAQRETDTMPQWAGSSWYFLRYLDPNNNTAIASPEAMNYWLPVDWYNGGMEHTTLHLLYSRFWHKFLFDIKAVPCSEPYAKRTSHGMILGEGGEKMSKSRGNVVNPDEIINIYGADTMRLYEMFIGDFEKSAPWNSAGIKGCKRFLERVYSLTDNLKEGETFSSSLEIPFNKAIKKVGEDIENLKANTAIATLMSLLNEICDTGIINRAELKIFILLLSPFAPHICAEIYDMAGFGDIHTATWPIYDKDRCTEETAELAVQVNGKIKARITVSALDTEEQVFVTVSRLPEIIKVTSGKTIIKQLYVPGRLVNIVV